MIAYPWSAVIGQEALKRALLLCAIDPALGGVLVQGPRGVAKTTLARALAELVPGRFVELPLGATEERVTGTLDLDAALREGRVAFAPGLLARAHDGVLYVDEVNLLPDPLVDLLLDAAASGRNIVERDGVSHEHAARFVLVGTMNPDEGTLRPQLLDRFGLAVHADGAISPDERAAIVTRRLEFDADPQGFVARFAAEQRTLAERCARARELAPRIPLAGPALTRVTELCHVAGVEGVRADLAMLRAARAHAAWHGRTEISIEDVDAVAELALSHRRRAGGSPHGGSPSGPNPSSSTTPPARGAPPTSHPNANANVNESANVHAHDHRGALAPVPVRATAVHALPSALLRATGKIASTRRFGAPRLSSARGARARQSPTGRIDWFATLTNARRTAPLTLRADELRRRARRAAPEQLWILALDCSASMLRGGALSAAKGAAHALESAARRAGAHLALIAFSGPSAHTQLTANPGQPAVAAAISRLGAGGGTPLRDALREAHDVYRRAALRSPQLDTRLVLLTDGKSRESVADLRDERVTPFVIDCERTTLRLGRARSLAQALGATYFHIDA
jgi:magnesium chelatase subunit D